MAKKSEPTKNCNCGVSTVCAIHFWVPVSVLVGDEQNLRHVPLKFVVVVVVVVVVVILVVIVIVVIVIVIVVVVCTVCACSTPIPSFQATRSMESDNDAHSGATVLTMSTRG